MNISDYIKCDNRHIPEEAQGMDKDSFALLDKTLRRLCHTGKTTPMSQILALAEEIEEYRAKIDDLHTLKDALAEKAIKFQEDNAHHVAMIENLATERNALRNALALATPGPVWISVAERLPNKPCACLVAAGIQVTMATWLPEENFWRALPHGYIFGPGYITHWMDLPELPEEVTKQ